MTAAVPTPAVDQRLTSDPRDGLEPHPNPDSWQDIKIQISQATGASWPDAERHWMDGLSQAEAQTLALRLATGRPQWTPNGGDA